MERLVAIYKEEMKDTKGYVLKEFTKYLDAYMWFKVEANFGTHVLQPSWSSVPGDIMMSGDASMLALASDFASSSDNGKVEGLVAIKQKTAKKSGSTLMEPNDEDMKKVAAWGRHLEAIEQSLHQLNKYIEMFLKQQNDGMKKYVEMEAMKQASEEDRKVYIDMVTKRAIEPFVRVGACFDRSTSLAEEIAEVFGICQQ